jgi:hypothetical protein
MPFKNSMDVLSPMNIKYCNHTHVSARSELCADLVLLVTVADAMLAFLYELGVCG